MKLNIHLMSASVILRFVIIGLLWLGACAVLVARMIAQQIPLTLLSLFPIIASGFIIFIPLYKKYVGNNKRNNGR